MAGKEGKAGIEGKSAHITVYKKTVKKTYGRDVDFLRELHGIVLMMESGTPFMVPVHIIDPLKGSIVYSRGARTMDLDRTDDVLIALLRSGAEVLDDIHGRDIVHGDFWLGNLVTKLDEPDSGRLMMIDFETAKASDSLEDKAKDILDYIQNLQVYFKTEGQREILERVTARVMDTVTEEALIARKLRTIVSQRVKPAIIGRLTEAIREALRR